MISFIKNYIDRKVKESIADHLKEIEKDYKKVGEKAALESINSIMYALINRRDGDEHYPQIGPPRNPIALRAYREIENYVKMHYRQAFSRLVQKEDRLLDLKKEALNQVSNKINERVYSEQFIDEIIKRIKDKQL